MMFVIYSTDKMFGCTSVVFVQFVLNYCGKIILKHLFLHAVRSNVWY